MKESKEMSKDKKKKKKIDIDIDALAKEYQNGIEFNKAKSQQLDGIIREAKLTLDEIKKLRDGLKKSIQPLDE